MIPPHENEAGRARETLTLSEGLKAREGEEEEVSPAKAGEKPDWRTYIQAVREGWRAFKCIYGERLEHPKAPDDAKIAILRPIQTLD